VDIHYAKLLEWLVSRKKLVADWRKRLAVIQAQTCSLSKDLPQGLRGEAPADYKKCKKISAELAKSAERTMFGGLTGPAKEWEKVVRVYDNGNVFLGEAALTLTSNTDYEIPFLRKQVAGLNSQVADLEKKAEELKNSASAAAQTFRDECKSLGIEGKSVRAEVMGLLIKLPELFAECVELCRGESVAKAMEYYAEFSKYSVGSNCDSAAALTTIAEVRDCTTVPLDVGLAQPSTEACGMEALKVKWGLTDIAAGVDWDLGVGQATAETPSTLNWDVEMEAETEPTLQWGVKVPVAVAEEEAGGAAPTLQWDVEVPPGEEVEPLAMQWDISMADGSDAGGINWGIGVAEEGTGEAVAIDWGAAEVSESAPLAVVHSELSSGGDVVVARLCGDIEYRNALLHGLCELQAFLVARAAEVRGTSASMLLSSAPEIVQQIGADAVAGMLEGVNAVLSSLSADKIRQLLKIKGSPQYTSRLVRSLEMKASQEGRLLSALKEVEMKRGEMHRQLVITAPKVQAAVEETRALKAQTEAKLQELIKRKVNIIGEINTVLNK